MTVLLVQAQLNAALVPLGMEILQEFAISVLLENINLVQTVLTVELESILMLEQPVVPVKIIIA